MDNDDNQVMKVEEVKTTPASRTIVTNSGQSRIIQDAYLEDVYLTLSVFAEEINGVYYAYDFVPVVIGQKIPLLLDDLYVWPVVTEIIDVK